MRPDVHAIACEKQYHPRQDGYTFPFQNKVMETLEFREEGFIAVVTRRANRDEDMAALNSQDGHPRKLILACLDESTHEARMRCLNVVKTVRNIITQYALHFFLSLHPLLTMLFILPLVS